MAAQQLVQRMALVVVAYAVEMLLDGRRRRVGPRHFDRDRILQIAAGQPFDFGGQLLTQGIGVGTAFVWTFSTCFIMFKVISKTIGLRVTPEEEMEGLDIGEHGASAYPDFVPSPSTGGVSMATAMDLPATVMQTRTNPAEL